VKDWGCVYAVARAAGERLGIRTTASYVQPRCRERATCVHGLGHCERPGDTRRSSSVPGYGPRLRVVRDILADRIKEGKKSFSCVTTSRRNFGVFNGLGYKFDSLTALLLCLSVLGSHPGILTMPGLPSSRLPAADLPPALWLLAVALVPTPRVVLPPALFAQAHPRTRSAPSSLRTGLSRNVMGAHGRISSQGKSSGRMRSHSLRALSKHE
jgi:hypothetical protein